jgi:hypothetical protein
MLKGKDHVVAACLPVGRVWGSGFGLTLSGVLPASDLLE